jgi:hypothetical protein
VTVGSNWERERLPIGTVISVGDPETLSRFGVLAKRPGGWTRVLGNYENLYGMKTLVLSVPDGTVADWVNEPGTEEEQEAITQFKARVWRIGWRAKLSHRWCSSYEQYMEQIGLTVDVLKQAKHAGMSIGDRVPPDQAALLPVGSVLRWQRHDYPDQFAWFIRDDSVDNMARTRRLFGSEGVGRHYASAMEVLHVHTHDDSWSIPVSAIEFERVPVGARFESDGGRFVVAQNRNIAADDNRDPVIPPAGPWSFHQFANGSLRLVGIS